jgi:hypothetical protein
LTKLKLQIHSLLVDQLSPIRLFHPFLFHAVLQIFIDAVWTFPMITREI